jgi:hypothetical protein
MQYEQLFILILNLHLLDTTRRAYFFDFQAVSYIFVICSNGVVQIFQADEF